MYKWVRAFGNDDGTNVRPSSRPVWGDFSVAIQDRPSTIRSKYSLKQWASSIWLI